MTNSTGASWSTDNTLVFAFNWGQPLRVLRPSSSAPEELTQFDTAAHEVAHLWPQVLRFDGSSKAEPLFPDVQGFAQSRAAWSPDHQHFVYPKPGNDSGSDLWMYTPGEKATTVALIATAANESDPAFSPDGRFIAYRSDESGQAEVWVRPFPDVESGRALISRNGGSNPVWTRSGREIVYATDQGLMSVPVTRTGSSVSSGEPSLVLKVSGVTSFDVSPDGQTFAIERTPLEKSAHEIHVIVNWFDELRRLVPAK